MRILIFWIFGFWFLIFWICWFLAFAQIYENRVFFRFVKFKLKMWITFLSLFENWFFRIFGFSDFSEIFSDFFGFFRIQKSGSDLVDFFEFIFLVFPLKIFGIYISGIIFGIIFRIISMVIFRAYISGLYFYKFTFRQK